MTDREERVLNAVDELVKGYVARIVAGVDTTELIARIREERQAGTTLKPTVESGRDGRIPSTATTKGDANRLWAACTWAAMTLLAVCGAYLGGRFVGPHAASAAVALRDVGSEHARGIDRCYRVQYSPDPRSWDGKNKLEGPSSSVLWTRGDRFWSDCTIGDIRVKVGCDSDGVLWVSPSSRKGVRFTNDVAQLPQVVSLLCAINSMIVPRLVDEVLADFNLHSERSVAGVGQRERTLIWARLKPGRTHPLLSDALLEIDSETSVLNRLVLWTVRDGQPKGIVTYSLIESSLTDGKSWSASSTQAADRYRLESHLEPGAQIALGTLAIPDELLADPAS